MNSRNKKQLRARRGAKHLAAQRLEKQRLTKRLLHGKLHHSGLDKQLKPGRLEKWWWEGLKNDLIKAFGIPDDAWLNLAAGVVGERKGCRMGRNVLWSSSGLRDS